MEQKKDQSYTLSDCPDWVQKHSSWKTWTVGRNSLLEKIRCWFQEHAPNLRDENPLQELAEHDVHVARLLTCLVCHWESAGRKQSPTEVIAKLEQGQGGDGRKLYNGTVSGTSPTQKIPAYPLCDLIFAEAFDDDQKKAKDRYADKLLPQLHATARRVYFEYDEKMDDSWIGDFYVRLCEPGKRNKVKPMQQYLGLGGIVPWLRKALAGFLADRFKKEKRLQDKFTQSMISPSDSDKTISPLEVTTEKSGSLLDSSEAPGPSDEAMYIELHSIIADALPEALKALESDDVLRLRLRYGMVKRSELEKIFKDRGGDTNDLLDATKAIQVQNQIIARLFGERDDESTRRTQRAVKRLRAALLEQIENREKFSAISENLPQLKEKLAVILSKQLGRYGGEQ